MNNGNYRPMWIASLLCALRVGAEPFPGQGQPVCVIVLPFVQANATAREAKLAPEAAETVRSRLKSRRELKLVEQDRVREELWRGRYQERDLPGSRCARELGKALSAKYVIAGFVTRFGTTRRNINYYDIRVRRATDGALVGWACERADLVREASMTTSSPASEQVERLGSYIAACIRRAGTGDVKPGQKGLAMVPFAESMENMYGLAAARMLETDLLSGGHYITTWLSNEAVPARTELLEHARKRGIKHVLMGKVVSTSRGLSYIQAGILRSSDGRMLRRARETFASDSDLRIATANLAQRLSPGGVHILWRWPSNSPFTVPAYSNGNLFVTDVTAGIAALLPLTGEALWRAKSLARGINPGSPVVSEDTIYVQSSRASIIYKAEIKHKAFSSHISFPSHGTPVPWPFLAGEPVMVARAGSFGLVGLDPDGEVSWTRTFRSELLWTGKGTGRRLVVGTRNGRVALLQVGDGKTVWERRMPERITSPPAWNNKSVFLGTEDGQRFALDLTDGSTRWSARQEGRSLAVPAASSERVFFSDENGTLTCYSAGPGKKLWERRLGGAARGALCVFGKVIYAPAADGLFYALGAEAGKLLWQVNLRGNLAAPPLVVPMEQLLEGPSMELPDWAEKYDHVIFLNSPDGYTYALGGSLHQARKTDQ